MVGDLVEMLKHEDRGIDRVAITTLGQYALYSNLNALFLRDLKLSSFLSLRNLDFFSRNLNCVVGLMFSV